MGNQVYLQDHSYLSENAIRSFLQGCSTSELSMRSGSILRNAAVLVPLFFHRSEWHLLFTRRSETVQDHKGQVSFPGGAVEAQDRTMTDTALREAHEEIGLSPQDVRILGCLVDFSTISNYLITPIVGVIPWPYQFHLEINEVSRVFGIPINWLADKRNWQSQEIITPEGRIRNVIHYSPYQGEILWGITARITVDFLNLLGLIKRQP